MSAIFAVKIQYRWSQSFETVLLMNPELVRHGNFEIMEFDQGITRGKSPFDDVNRCRQSGLEVERRYK